MPYVERIYKGKPTGERYFTTESARKLKSCGNCAAACGIEGKNEVVGCKEDGKLHNAQEQNTCFYVEDCDTCVHKYMY